MTLRPLLPLLVMASLLAGSAPAGAVAFVAPHEPDLVVVDETRADPQIIHGAEILPGATLTLTGTAHLEGELRVHAGGRLVLRDVHALPATPTATWRIEATGALEVVRAEVEGGTITLTGPASTGTFAESHLHHMRGLLAQRRAEVVVDQTRIDNSSGRSPANGGLSVLDATATVRGSVLLDNRGWGIGLISTVVGQHAFGPTRAHVVDTVVRGSAWGIHTQGLRSDLVVLEHNLVVDNWQALNAQASSDPTIRNNTFLRNTYAVTNFGNGPVEQATGQPPIVVDARGNYWGGGAPTAVGGEVLVAPWLPEDPNPGLTARWS